MKLLVACDYTIRPDMLKGLKEFEKYDCKIEFFDNEDLSTEDSIYDIMLQTDKYGAESVKANPNFVEAVKDADFLIVHYTIVNKEVIEAAKKLKLIGVMRGGCDNVNTKLLKEKNIPVVNAPWRSSYAVADFTVGMMISETKNIAKSHFKLMNGEWSRDYPNAKNYTDMKNRTIGIIGFGFIGQRVAQNLNGFGCKILVHDPFLKDEIIKSLGYDAVSLEELLKTCDIVSLHLRCSEKTLNFIGEKELNMKRNDATLINSARAGLIDTDALLKALKNHKILGAAIDVFNEEPLPKDSPFMKLDNVTITPHIAGVSNDTV